MPEWFIGVLIGQGSMIVVWWGSRKYHERKQHRNNWRVGRAVDNPLGG